MPAKTGKRWRRGEKTGRTRLAVALMRGDGVAQDEVEARYWLQKAAEGGSETAADTLSGLGM